ncbi:MAG: hypothetical protein R3F59_22680 [Myxococcota bacterium]
MWVSFRRSPAPVDPALLEAFRIDPDTGAAVLEVVVSGYDDLFNVLDRAPFRRRDLSVDLKQYLHDCSGWVPLPHPIAFEVLLTRDLRDEAREQEAATGIHAYFAYLVHLQRAEGRRQRPRIAAFAGLSFALLSAALLLTDQVDRGGVLQAFLLNGFTVGGWLFLWEALSIAFVRRLDRREQIQRLQRLVDAPIRFTRAEATAAS